MADDNTSVIIVRSDGASLNISIYDVASIIDTEGVNIREDVIPRHLLSFDEFRVVNDPGHIYESINYGLPISVNLFEAMFSLGLGYGFPMGDYYAGLESGLLYFADARVAVSPLVYVKFSYRSENLYRETVTIYPGDYGSSEDIDATVTARQYLVSMGFLNGAHNRSKIRAYGELGVGWVDHVLKFSQDSQSGSINEGRFMATAGAGFLAPIKGSVGLDFGFSVLLKLHSEGNYEGGGVLFNCYLGATVSFGGGA